MKIGIGFDVHAFCEGNSIKLCGVDIPHNKGIKAHSDGDTAIHALVDAILGALGEGDIGEHFPPSDEKWKNTNSEIFLNFAKELMRKKGFDISNVDITIICEKPKIGLYKKEMTTKLCSILETENINIKATTTEKLGFTGREEGIAVQAAVLLKKTA